MVDSFKGNKHITLRPGVTQKPVWMKFNAASASTANDGSMPYGSTLHSFSVQIKDEITNTATTQLHSAVGLSSNKGIVYLRHSTAVSTGLYHIIGTATISLTGTTQRMTELFDLERVYVVNK